MKIIRVDTDGEALLRNGFSQVKVLEVVLNDQGRAAVQVVNSRGTVTNGGIWVPKDALLTLARALLTVEPQPPVIIEVDGGVVSVAECPDWVAIEIVDHDQISPEFGITGEIFDFPSGL